ncbi:uncharacterized protein LOC135494922 [Lineus longissimus]|uniref:uncharacterized protein LOC135494922 n=1 Tax=Lineus longissimus TaxID=88925 RepID=UPI002B4DA5A5
MRPIPISVAVLAAGLLVATVANSIEGASVLGKMLRMKRGMHGVVRLPYHVDVDKKARAECHAKHLIYNSSTRKCCARSEYYYEGTGKCMSVLPKGMCPKGKKIDWTRGLYHSPLCINDNDKAAKQLAEKPVLNGQEKKYMRKILTPKGKPAKHQVAKTKKHLTKDQKKKLDIKKAQMAAFKAMQKANRKKQKANKTKTAGEEANKQEEEGKQKEKGKQKKMNAKKS